MTISFVLKFVLIWKLCLEFDNFSRTFDKFLKTLFVLFSSTICKHLFLSFDLIICRKFFSFYYFLIFQHFCMFWLHINVLCTFTQTFKVWVEVFYYIYFSQETCEVKKKCEIFFSHLSSSPERFPNFKFDKTWHTKLGPSPKSIKWTKNFVVNFRFYIRFYHVQYLFWSF